MAWAGGAGPEDAFVLAPCHTVIATFVSLNKSGDLPSSVKRHG